MGVGVWGCGGVGEGGEKEWGGAGGGEGERVGGGGADLCVNEMCLAISHHECNSSGGLGNMVHKEHDLKGTR